MTQFIYDGSFAGLLTAVFEIYEKKCADASIVARDRMEGMVFLENTEIISDDQKAQRVWKGLKNRLSEEAMKNIYWSFLSEIKGIETVILNFAKYVFGSSESIEDNFGNAAVLAVSQAARKVGREKHRFEAFVRFEALGDDLFYAPIDPDFNVLPIIIPHFKRRYPAMNWIIYDTRRRYGIHYNQHTEAISEISIEFAGSGQLAPTGLV